MSEERLMKTPEEVRQKARELLQMPKEEVLTKYMFQEQEIERLNKKIEQYENPEDMTLMFMWCDEKAKDEIKRLNNIINELEKWVVESIEKYTEDYLDWKYDRNVYLAGSKKLQNVLDKLQELKGSDK